MMSKHIFQKEPVLSIATCLAIISAFFVPQLQNTSIYIDFRTLAILFFANDSYGRTGEGKAYLIDSAMPSYLIPAPFAANSCSRYFCFSSMLITNDVSLLTFVPFTFVVLNSLNASVRRKLLLPIVCMQTIAANLGSMLTPLGNPQNLYLYGKSGMDMTSFVLLMLPYSIISLVLIAIWAVWLCREGSDIVVTHSAVNSEPDKKLIALYGILFVACLLVVLRVLPYGVAFVAILVCTFFADRPTLGRVDYSLILTFVALFIFIGNLGRMEAFSGWLQNILAGHEVLVSVLASQVTSNVPAAILLSGFTDNFRALIIGTNLGGLGTLIASMASLISYRQIANEVPAEKGHYFAMFTISNVVFLAILMGAWAMT